MTDPFDPSDVASLGRELTPRDHEQFDPPSEVWTGIEQALTESPPTEGTVLAFERRGSRPRRGLAPLVVAAAVVALAGIAGVLLLRGGPDSGATVAEVAMTDDGLQVAAPDDGRAELIETDDGYAVELDIPALPESDGFYEVWLIDVDVDGMYSLGTIDRSGRLAVPDGVDPATHPIIDISVEPLDGDPTHSGRSVLRGTLEV